MKNHTFKELDQIIDFGSYKGRKTIKEVIDEEPGYIEWAIHFFKGFKLGKKVKEYYYSKQNLKI